MALDSNFQFNQGNLQDYLACPRRFELRYVERRRWPALQSEPVLEQERHMQQGKRFHQMVQQYILNIPANYAGMAATDQDLAQWWDEFQRSKPLADLPAQRYPEHTLSARLGGFRLIAKYDLLAIDPGGCAMIVDWKTGRRPKERWLKERVQSRLYPYLLVQAGAYLNGAPLQPEQVRMMYWFASAPDQPLVCDYSRADFLADHAFLMDLIESICATPPGQFLLAGDERTCRFCVYRSLCGRGDKAGDWREMEEDWEEESPLAINLDFDQIGEISF